MQFQKVTVGNRAGALRKRGISFQELAVQQKEMLSRQSPTTLEKAKEQVQLLKKKSSSKSRKLR
jgi:hypothetical protein